MSSFTKEDLVALENRLKKLEKNALTEQRTIVKIDGKKASIKKAHKNPNFKKKTVLTHDTWRYVDIYLHSRKCTRALKYWKQARQFFIASKHLEEFASPLTLYYCYLNAVKALLYSKNQEFNSFYHGIKSEINDNGISIFSEEMTLKNGVFRGLCEYFKEDYCIGKSYSLKWILYNIPYIHRSFNLTYPGHGNLFIPITKPSFVYDRKTRCIWFEAQLEKKYSNQRTLNKLVKFQRDDFYKGKNLVVRSKEKIGGFDSYSLTRVKKSYYKKFFIFYNKIRKCVTYIHGPRDLWYIKRCELSKSIPWNTLELTFAAMHKLSCLARYDPEKLEKYLTKKSHWILSEFINISPTQFIDQIACEITGCSLKIPGIKYSEN